MRTVPLLVLLAGPLCSQTTHVVGPGGLPQIRDALAIAAPGDVIHVLPGTYAHFTANVGVTIRALVPGSVTVAYDALFAPPGCLANPFCAITQGATTFAPPNDQAVHVTDVTFAPNVVGSFTRHRVVVASGTVTFDGCTIDAWETTALSITDALVHLHRCHVAGQGLITAHALIASSSHLTMVDSTIVGNSTFSVATPGDAVRVVSCTLKASGCSFTGGTLMFGGPDGAALRTDAESRVWISDSTLIGGNDSCAIQGTPAVGQIARCTVTQVGAACGTMLAAPLIGVELPAPIQNGSIFFVHMRTEPNVLVAVHASPRLGHYEFPGVLAQPSALDLTSFFAAGVFISDNNGDVTAVWGMPAGEFIDETIWLETIAFLPASPIIVGPVVGGVIR